MLILDTNVISESMREKPAPQVIAWFSAQPVEQTYTTTITEAETFSGIEQMPASKRRTLLRSIAESYFEEDFKGRLLPFDSAAARVCASIVAACKAKGKPAGFADAQIAAIVRLHGATLATRNTVHFENCGIRLFNPWL